MHVWHTDALESHETQLDQLGNGAGETTILKHELQATAKVLTRVLLNKSTHTEK